MKKFFSQKDTRNKKNRGVAIVFTLGILGLLTVIALGFASTALFNNKLASNSVNTAYVKKLASNVALPRAIFALQNLGVAHYIYSSSDDPDPAKDWLWQMDTELERNNNASSKDGFTVFKFPETEGDAKRKPHWIYVKDDDGSIIGRYAFAVIPDMGHLDPNVNNGSATNAITSVSSTDPVETIISNPKNISAPTSGKYLSLREINNGNGTPKDYFEAGINVGQPPSPEAYWLDDSTKSNGLNQINKDELYARFNLIKTKTDWEKLKPEDLCTGTDTSYTDEKSLSFIPWLRDMYSNSVTKTQALQIAANILQYNRPGPNALDSAGNPIETIVDSDKMGTDWLTSKPTYAGIGRHPMLNEIGFRVIIKAEVGTEEIKDAAGNITDYKYTPKYLITVESGAELVCPFFDPTTSADISAASVKFPESGHLEIKLRNFKQQDEISNISSFSSELDEIVTDPSVPLVLETDKAKLKTNNWNKVDLNLDNNGTGSFYFAQTDWNASPAYTKTSKFWKSQTEQTVYYSFDDSNTHSFTLPGDKKTTDQTAKILNWMEIQHINFKPGYAVMYYGPDQSIARQRDFAVLKDEAEVKTQKVGEKKWVFFISYEAKDPLVNHNEDDWKITKSDAEYPTTGTAAELDKLYPGTIVDSSGTEKHVNSTIDDELNASGLDEQIRKELETFKDGKRISASYIRHKPMSSLWELGCISRGEAWRTLNLKKKSSGTPDYSYDKGDGVLFDQIKTSDEQVVYGKLNMNSDSVSPWKHQAWEGILSDKKIDYHIDFDQASSESNLLVAGTATDSSTPTPLKLLKYDPAATPPALHTDSSADCLICAILKITKDYRFKNRADILLKDVNDLPLAKKETRPQQADWNKMQDLLLTGDSYLEKIQVIGKIMPLLKAEPTGDMYYIIILAQTIRDIGGISAFCDWDGDGEISSSAHTSGEKILRKAGYLRPKETTVYDTTISPSLPEAYSSTTKGTYDIGVDKITSSTKLVARVVKDPATGKWVIRSIQYLDD